MDERIQKHFTEQIKDINGHSKLDKMRKNIISIIGYLWMTI